MDPHLRVYLEQPAPRPEMHDARYDQRHGRWLFAIGGAFTGSMLMLGIADEPRQWLFPGGPVLVGLILFGYGGGWLVTRLNQRLYRTGTFCQARVIESKMRSDGEDARLELILGVELDAGASDYRAAPERAERRFSMSLTERWFKDGGGRRFEVGVTLPILFSANGREARVFLDDEALSAGPLIC